MPSGARNFTITPDAGPARLLRHMREQNPSPEGQIAPHHSATTLVAGAMGGRPRRQKS